MGFGRRPIIGEEGKRFSELGGGRGLFGEMGSWWGGFGILLFIMQEKGFMINDFFKQLFEWNNRISSPHSSDKFFIGRSKATSSVNK